MLASNSLRRRLALAALLPAGLAFVPAQADAQSPPPRATVASLTPYVGYIDFGDFAKGPLGSRVSNAGAALFGATVGIDMNPRVSLIGNLGYADTQLRGNLPLVGGYSFGDSKVLLFDANVQVRLLEARPASSATATQVIPFAEVGVGGLRFDQTIGPLNATSTNVAFNLGGGIDIRLSPQLALRLMAKDYIGKFDFADAFGEAIGGRINSSVANNIALTAGLKLAF